MPNAAPGFAKHRNHTVEITPANGFISVSIDNQVIGKTDAALALAEAGYPVAYYLPLETLEPQLLEPSDHSTYCPFKGTANYFHLKHNGNLFENAVWTYKDPYDEATAIRGHIAIYGNVASVGPA